MSILKTSILPFLFIFCSSLSLFGQDKMKDSLEYVNSIDNILFTLYNVISGAKGEKRDWQLMNYLFHEDAKLIPVGKNKTGKSIARFLTLEEYIQTSGKWLVENGFFEVEVHRTTNTFGPVTQVFSTYESFQSLHQEKPFMRGINSIQLLDDGERWWIINIYWSQETQENQIPSTYLPRK